MKTPQLLHRNARSCHKIEQRHRAFTLIELVLVISMFGFISVIGVRLLTLMFEADTRSAERVIVQLNRERLASQFRHDVLQANSSEVSETGTQLKLFSRKGNVVVYDVSDVGITRTLPNSRRRVSRDRFRLDDVTCRFESTPRLITLIVEQADNAETRLDRMEIMDDVTPPIFVIHAVTRGAGNEN